mgnify:CR=1 FL=1
MKKEQSYCCVADQACTAPANLENAFAKGVCFCCGGYVCSKCSSKRNYFGYGEVRLCNNCQITYDGNDTKVMKRLIKLVGEMYSTISNSKFGICNCPDCKGAEVAGRKVGKKFHCLSSYSRMKALEQMEKAKKKNALRVDTKKVKKLGVSQDQDKKLLELWFAKIAAEIRQNPRCWECNSWIAPEFYRHASAHIFMKSIFPSVATHPLNYLILGATCGCHDKTHRLDTFCKMGIWKEAVDRFKEFEPCITETHKYLNTFRQLVYG